MELQLLVYYLYYTGLLAASERQGNILTRLHSIFLHIVAVKAKVKNIRFSIFNAFKSVIYFYIRLFFLTFYFLALMVFALTENNIVSDLTIVTLTDNLSLTAHFIKNCYYLSGRQGGIYMVFTYSYVCI